MKSSIRSLRATSVCAVLALVAALLIPAVAEAVSLRGSRASMDRQNLQARRHGYSFLANPAQVRDFVAKGYLVRIPGNDDYTVKQGVPFPYARPEVQVFLERLGEQYRGACGQKLVVTSLTRPKSHQPWNSSPRSVHPTGMALDLRVSWSRTCRRWIESVFLSLEAKGVLDANREYHPPHYHVVLFPEPYMAYVARLEGKQGSEPRYTQYRVRRGDSLWRIARRHGTSVRTIKVINSMRGDRIKPGQVLALPAN